MSSRPEDGLASPALVTFTPDDWRDERAVLVRGPDDGVADGDQPYRIVTAPAVSDDPAFDGLDPPDVEARNVARDGPLPTGFDWYAEFLRCFPERPLEDPGLRGLFVPSPPYGMAYYMGRYALNALAYLYRATGETRFLREGLNQLAQMFDPDSWFEDGENGADDGLLGWGYRRSDGIDAVPGGPAIGAWHPFHYRVRTDAAGIVTFRLTVGGQTFEERSTGAEPSGAIALLSGWSQTSFRDLVVTRPDGGLIYELNASPNTFEADWAPVHNEDLAAFPHDTGVWSLVYEAGVEADGLGGPVITCDATSNDPQPFYFPDSPDGPEDDFIPYDGWTDGKFAALVLVRPGADALADGDIEGEIRFDARSTSFGMSGVATRWRTEDPTERLLGRRLHDELPVPGHLSASGYYDRNTHFEEYATHVDALFLPGGAVLTRRRAACPARRPDRAALRASAAGGAPPRCRHGTYCQVDAERCLEGGAGSPVRSNPEPCGHRHGRLAGRPRG